MREFDVIGGLADGQRLFGRAAASIEFVGEPYIALEFAPDPNLKKKTVTIYMRCGMTPADAMRIWRERNMNDEAYDKLRDLANQLLASTQEQADAEPGGRENFAQYLRERP